MEERGETEISNTVLTPVLRPTLGTLTPVLYNFSEVVSVLLHGGILEGKKSKSLMGFRLYFRQARTLNPKVHIIIIFNFCAKSI